MSIINGLRQAKYSNNIGSVTMLFNRVSTNGGRKTATHEFVGGSRYVEDLGVNSKTFELQIVINETSKIDYDRVIKRFERILFSSSKTGVLVIPTENINYDVRLLAFNKTESIDKLNTANYSLTFSRTLPDPYPKLITLTTNNSITRAVQKVQESISDVYDSIFSVDENKNSKQFQEARDTLTFVTDAINQEVGRVNSVPDLASSALNDVTDFQNSLNSLIRSPQDLANRSSQIFNNFKLITDNFGNLLNSSLRLIKFENPSSVKSCLSQRGQRIKDNNDAIFQAFNANALALAYQSAFNINFSNTDNLDNTRKDLNNQYDIVSPTLEYDIFIQLEELRNLINDYFDQLRVNLRSVLTINVKNENVTTLAYQYYNDVSRSSDLQSLNKFEDPAFVEGEIKILSS